MYKSSIIAKTIPKEMATKTPVEIGSRGTVGSLIMQEIEYFSRLELGCRGSSQKPHCQITDMGSTSNPRPKLGSLIMAAKKKKRGGRRLVPSMCSMVEVADRNPPNGIAGFSYRNLKADVKKIVAFCFLGDFRAFMICIAAAIASFIY
ncbi:hypothetical protein F0562_008811 [Nyssa sinensis]|uniref:Uncharacterized protein n=1 Tax=Nyssa sinensis TaxID=561372 RepID=A0A5J5A8X7_9ASTE|nr:hypothetical protein F0562_008811 [Nyssa sinensis]